MQPYDARPEYPHGGWMRSTINITKRSRPTEDAFNEEPYDRHWRSSSEFQSLRLPPLLVDGRPDIPSRKQRRRDPAQTIDCAHNTPRGPTASPTNNGHFSGGLRSVLRTHSPDSPASPTQAGPHRHPEQHAASSPASYSDASASVEGAPKNIEQGTDVERTRFYSDLCTWTSAELFELGEDVHYHCRLLKLKPKESIESECRHLNIDPEDLEKRLEKLHYYTYAVFFIFRLDTYCLGLIFKIFPEIESAYEEERTPALLPHAKQVLFSLSNKVLNWVGDWMHLLLEACWSHARVIIGFVPEELQKNEKDRMNGVLDTLSERPQIMKHLLEDLFPASHLQEALCLNIQDFSQPAFRWMRFTLGAIIYWLTLDVTESKKHMALLKDQKQRVTSMYFKHKKTRKFARRFIRLATKPGDEWLRASGSLPLPGKDLKPKDFFMTMSVETPSNSGCMIESDPQVLGVLDLAVQTDWRNRSFLSRC